MKKPIKWAFFTHKMNCLKNIQKNVDLLLTKDLWDDILNFVVEEETRQQNDFEKSRK